MGVFRLLGGVEGLREDSVKVWVRYAGSRGGLKLKSYRLLYMRNAVAT